jgi:hypothetical protein
MEERQEEKIVEMVEKAEEEEQAEVKGEQAHLEEEIAKIKEEIEKLRELGVEEKEVVKKVRGSEERSDGLTAPALASKGA